jgi:FMN phosphatase YigB (HAD superfamily)
VSCSIQVASPFQAIREYELAHNIPLGWVNFSIARSAPDGAWQRLERGEIKLDEHFFDIFNLDLRSRELWSEYCNKTQSGSGAGPPLPPLPEIDGEWLFWEMMRVARNPEPHMFTALKKLKASEQFLVAALSNTVIFPTDHPYSEGISGDLRSQFDVFISSAHVGLRKPDPRIYLYAMTRMDEYVREKARKGDLSAEQRDWDRGITASDVVFLDDIGENLRAAKELGMSTIKVQFGKAMDAVKELEKVTGIRLVEEEVSRHKL